MSGNYHCSCPYPGPCPYHSSNPYSYPQPHPMNALGPPPGVPIYPYAPFPPPVLPTYGYAWGVTYYHEKTKPILKELDASTFISASSAFEKFWKHSSECPTVRRVYKIRLSAPLREAYKSYKESVEARCSQDSVTVQRWHGTHRACRLGEGNQDEPCKKSDCSLCSIICNSFDVSMCGEGKMFGKGIYTTATSSKANNYSSNSFSSSVKAMLVNEVVAGNICRMEKGDRTLTRPPPGFDSVRGVPGSQLNYDETIVYRNDAICPLLLIMYDDV